MEIHFLKLQYRLYFYFIEKDKSCMGFFFQYSGIDKYPNHTMEIVLISENVNFLPIGNGGKEEYGVKLFFEDCKKYLSSDSDYQNFNYVKGSKGWKGFFKVLITPEILFLKHERAKIVSKLVSE